MTDNREAIRTELNGALTALATAWHALGVAATLARQDGDDVQARRYRVIAYDLAVAEGLVGRVRSELR